MADKASKGNSFPTVPETGPADSGAQALPAVTLPPKSKVQILTGGENRSLSVFIPGGGLLGRTGGRLSRPIYLLLFGIFWTALLLAVPVFVAISGAFQWGVLICLPFAFIGIFMMLVALRNADVEETLQFRAGQFSLTRNWWGWKSQVAATCKEILAADIQTVTTYVYVCECAVPSGTASWCVLAIAEKHIKFGYVLTFAEQQYIISEIAQFLGVPMGSGVQLPAPHALYP